jgi:hypothetical protein
MPSPAEYYNCARMGLTQSAAARHLGVSHAAVSKAKARLGLVFGDWRSATQGREVPMEFYRYPWAKLNVGDWCHVPCYPAAYAWRANQRHPDRRFVGKTIEHGYAVLRAA